METRRFRNHISILLENLGSLIFLVLVFIVTQSAEIIEGIVEGGFSIKSMLLTTSVFFLIFTAVCTWQYLVWSKTWIILENDTISIERKTLNTSKNTIGIKNISNVNIEQNLFEMVIGTCKVKLDTDSLSTANTTDVLIILKKSDAESLRNTLVKRMNEITEGTDDKADKAVVGFDDDNVEYDDKAEMKDILMNGLYSINVLSALIFLGSIAGIISSAIEIVESGINLNSVSEAANSILVIGVLLISSLSSMVKSFFGMYGFMVKRDGNRLYIKYGLFKKVNFAIPVDRINAIKIHQTTIARIFKKYTAEMINVGMGDEENSSAYFTFYSSREKLQNSIDVLLPEFSEAVKVEFERQPKAVIKQCVISEIIGFVIFGTIGAVVYHYTSVPGIVIMVVVALIMIFSIFYDYRSYISTGTSITPNYLGLQEGAFGMCRTIIRFDKVQYVTFSHNPLERKLGIIDGSAHILAMLGNETQKIPYVSEDKVEIIKKYILEKKIKESQS